jgi:TP901 family phage tail tape measure protein
MSSEDYSVGIKLSLVENVSRGLLAMGERFALLNKQADVFQARLASLRSQIATGAGLVGFGALIAAPILGAVNQASKLQQQLSFIQEKTKSNTDEMYKFRGAVEDIAGTTGFTSTQIATSAKTLTLGLNATLAQIQDVLPMFSEFAAVQLKMKNTPIQTSVTQALQLVHLTGEKTDPKSIKENLDLLSKISLIMPGDITKVLNAEKYAQGTLGNLLGVSPQQSMLLFAALNRMGIEGTRAGSQLLSAINRSMGKGILWAGLLPGKSGENLEKIGLTKNNIPQFLNNGKFDTQKWLSILGNFVNKEYATKKPNVATGEIATIFAQTLATTGTRIAAALSTTEGRKQLEELNKSFDKMPVLSEQFKQLNTLLSMQVSRSLSNLNSLFTELGYALLPDATDVMGVFADKIRDLTLYVHSHQGTVALIEKLVLGFSAFLILGGTFIMLRAALVGLFIPIQLLITYLPMVASGILAINIPMLLIVGSIVLLGVALYELYKHWDVVKVKIKQLGEVFSYLAHSIESLYKSATSWLHTFSASHPKTTKVANTIGEVGSFLLNPASKLESLFNFGRNLIKSPSTTLPHIIMPSPPIKNIAANHLPLNKAQPIHVHINMDGRKVAHAVATHIADSASHVPNGSSQFDTSLGPMPTIANSYGIT